MKRLFEAENFASLASRPTVAATVVLLLLVGLPVAAWLDFKSISEHTLRTQANALDRAITSIRTFYSRNIVNRVLNSEGRTQVAANYHDIPGAIPIPSTLSLELGAVIGEQQGNMIYRFISDYPWIGRPPHAFDDFERKGLEALRRNPEVPIRQFTGSLFDGRFRLVAPILMRAECVACHNSDPSSPKRDWAVGDVGGIQEVLIDQPIATNLFSFKYLLSYFVAGALAGACFIALLRRQTSRINSMNRQLYSDDYVEMIASKIAHYLSPQVLRSIFSGEREVAISTERKKLTIFFSDIQDFTSITERLQPEELTALLNEYLTEMSTIALAHGATIDKFIGDAFLVFFGDPETKGVAEDAKACLRMAVDMQRRLAVLNARWRGRGVEQPFRVRMGINTGFCNVGNFGSNHRMEYTILGAEANLAARLQSIAEAGSIVMSFETYALVRYIVRARPLAPICVKGISREIMPYVVEDLVTETGWSAPVFNEHSAGIDLFLDVNAMDHASVDRVSALLHDALATLDRRKSGGTTAGLTGGASAGWSGI